MPITNMPITNMPGTRQWLRVMLTGVPPFVYLGFVLLRRPYNNKWLNKLVPGPRHISRCHDMLVVAATH